MARVCRLPLVARAVFGPRARTACLLALAWGVAGCPPQRTVQAPASSTIKPPAHQPKAPADEPLLPQNLDAILSAPQLCRRLSASPYAYYRAIAQETTQSICRRYDDALPWMPPFNLHGDAHVEQFAVTERSYGLADFDQAAVGPAVVDLLRFAVSLQLAAELRGWDWQPLVEQFLAAYGDALEGPQPSGGAPAVVERLRSRVRHTRTEWLDWVSARIHEPTRPLQSPLREQWSAYVELMIERNPALSPGFFEVKSGGPLIRSTGIGSFLQRKLILRLEGASAQDADDVIVELKPMSHNRHVACVAHVGGAFEVVRAARLFGGEPLALLARIPRVTHQPLEGPVYVIHEWTASYQEVSVAGLRSPDELLEVALDVARELGQLHARYYPSDDQPRREQLRLHKDLMPRMAKDVPRITASVRAGWEQFKQTAQRQPDCGP